MLRPFFIIDFHQKIHVHNKISAHPALFFDKIINIFAIDIYGIVQLASCETFSIVLKNQRIIITKKELRYD